MADQNLFILYAIPDEKIVAENGARKITLLYAAANIRQARAMAPLKFLEQYPDADDADFELVVYEDAPGLPRGALDVWDEDILTRYNWNEEARRPEPRAAQPIEFEKLSSIMKIAVLVKYMTTEITSDMLPAAFELTLDEASSFPGHIVEAISKTPTIASMYPERIIEAIKYVVDKCPTTKKWPEIKAQLANWQNSLKDTPRTLVEDNAPAATNSTPQLKPGSGDPERFDLIVAFLVAGVNPEKAGAADVKNAKFIKESRDAAWRAWRTTLVGIPGIYEFPESELYALTLDGMKDLKLIKDNEGRLAYVRNRFAGHALLPDYPALTEEGENTNEEPQEADAVADDQDNANAVEQEQPVSQSQETPETVTERQGPFYYRTPDGEVGRANKLPKLEAVLAQGCEEISKDEYLELKNQPTREEVSRQLAAQRGDYVEGISDPDDPKWVKTEVNAQPEFKNCGNGVFSADNLLTEDVIRIIKAASNEVEKQEVTQGPAAPVQNAGDFQSVAASLEKDLSDKPAEALDNLKLWRSVMRTDPRFTKDITGTGFDGTSVNAEYMIMRATELFGPLGSGWGFDIQEEKMMPGAPMSEPVYDGKNVVGLRFLRDVDGTLITEQHHSMRIRLWYETDNHDGSVISYGATPYMYKTKLGVKCDGEAPKKSLTDAIKKALSMLGFSADVWLGMYDKPEYVAEVGVEFGIKTASEKAEDTTRLRTELDEKMTRVASTIESAVTPNEAKKTYDTLAREVEIHRKAADSKGDAEHAKYLSGRLRRLNQIKDERIKALNEQQEQTA
ncbi:exodeoxyribonuclease VIII [Salmonella enterica]|uniref:exodeoxyribonuclease VIII n=1 Tax=Salmonella enterica TaxID=28901 RepID=UPI00316927F1